MVYKFLRKLFHKDEIKGSIVVTKEGWNVPDDVFDRYLDEMLANFSDYLSFERQNFLTK